MTDILNEGGAKRQPPARIWPPRLAAYLSRLEDTIWRIAVVVQKRTDAGRDALETQKNRIDGVQQWRQGTVNPALQQISTKLDDLDAADVAAVNRLDGIDATLSSLATEDTSLGERIDALEARVAALENAP